MTHKLEFINILTDDGLINENGGPYQGQKRFDVRYTIQEDLKKLGLYVDKKDNPMTVPLSERSKDIVEPVMKPQWWVKMSELAGDAVRPKTPGMCFMSCFIYSHLSHRSKRSRPARSRSGPSRRRSATSTGCQTSTIGASQDSCGGDISAPYTVFASRERPRPMNPTTGGSRDEAKKKVRQPSPNPCFKRPMLIKK